MVSVLIVAYATSSMAVNESFPRALIFKGKPVDPLCFYQTGENHHTDLVQLQTCGLHREHGRSLREKNTHLTDQGYFGYEFSWDMDSGPAMQGYSYYKPIGQVDSSILVQTINNGGGTGRFTTLSLVQRIGDALQIKELSSGDRCNHGLEHASIVQSSGGDSIIYGVRITPFDFITLSHQNTNHLKAYDDLDACAACCMGVAVFSRTFKDINHDKLNYIDLTGVNIPVENSQDISGVKYQNCFNQVLSTFKKNTGNQLSPDDLNHFIKQFNHTCVKKPKTSTIEKLN